MASAMLLIDADLLLHRTAAVTERDIDWGDSVSTIHCDHEEMKEIAKRGIKKIIEEVGMPHVKVMLVFSGENNFRKALCPNYKANRQGRKPVGYAVLKEWLMKSYPSKYHPGLEADDLMGIMQTCGKYGKSVIVSDDKDMLQIPGLLYRPGAQEMLTVSVTDGHRHHMMQTLCGDRADNYPGLPGCGDKTAEKILGDDPVLYWEYVIKAFEDKGLTEADALLQARLAKILQFTDYNTKTRKPILWTPSVKSTAPTVTKTSTSPAPPTKTPKSASPKVKATRQSTSRTTTRSGKSSRSRSSSKTNSTTESVT